MHRTYARASKPIGKPASMGYQRKRERIMSELQIAEFITVAEGESEQVRNFALIPAEWADKLDQHPQDDEIFYWCDEQEWLTLGAGEVLGGVEIIACSCGECESERVADDDE